MVRDKLATYYLLSKSTPFEVTRYLCLNTEGTTIDELLKHIGGQSRAQSCGTTSCPMAKGTACPLEKELVADRMMKDLGRYLGKLEAESLVYYKEGLYRTTKLGIEVMEELCREAGERIEIEAELEGKVVPYVLGEILRIRMEDDNEDVRRWGIPLSRVRRIIKRDRSLSSKVRELDNYDLERRLNKIDGVGVHWIGVARYVNFDWDYQGWGVRSG